MINSAIIVLNSLEREALPIGINVSPEFWLLHGASLIERLADEAVEAGAAEITIVGSTDHKGAVDYLKKISSEKPESNLFSKDVNFNFLLYSDNLISTFLKIKNKGKSASVAVMLAHQFLASPVNPFLQMKRISNTANKTVLGVVERQEDLSGGGLKLEKVADRIYKVKEIIPAEESSFLSIGRIIATPEFWENMQEMKKEGKIGVGNLEEVIDFMTSGGKDVYGFNLEGNCYDFKKGKSWLAVNKFLAENDYGESLH